MPATEFYDSWENTDETIAPYVRYEYDNAGRKTREIISDFNNNELQTIIENDSIGRIIRIMKDYTGYENGTPLLETLTEQFKYDNNGNKTEYRDGNNHTWNYVYDERNQLTCEKDPLGNKTTYEYDNEGNKISMTDPHGNSTAEYTSTFTVDYKYDDLNRLIAGIMPKGYNEEERGLITLEYDRRGNVTNRIEVNGQITHYEYNKRNKVISEEMRGTQPNNTPVTMIMTYTYDLAGNREYTTDGEGNTTFAVYDEMNRVIEEHSGPQVKATYEYDIMGNVTRIQDGNAYGYNRGTFNTYNPYGKIIQSINPAGQTATMSYDIRGNTTKAIDPRGLTYLSYYDELGRLVKEQNSEGNIATYAYDKAGNLVKSIDFSGDETTYTYNDNNTLSTITYADGRTVIYTYDEAGEIKTALDNDVLTEYNYIDGTYTPDPFSRIYNLDTTLDGRTFPVEYEYNNMNWVTAVTNVQGNKTQYDYNSLGQLLTVPGYIDTPIDYYANGLMNKLEAVNGVTKEKIYDTQNRLLSLSYGTETKTIKSYEFEYDPADNILIKTIDGNNNFFGYDNINQIMYATNNGDFEVDITKKPPQKAGTAPKDYAGNAHLDFPLTTEEVRLDRDSQSIGADLISDSVKITRIILKADTQTDRITKENLDLAVSSDNTDEEESWTHIPREDWILMQIDEQTMEIRLREPVPGRYVKVHCFIDDRDEDGNTQDLSAFGNVNTQILSVYYSVDKTYETFDYDDSGNRITYEKQVPGEEQEAVIKNITYYVNTNHVKSDGEWGYVWDLDGNLVMKGKSFDNTEMTIDVSETEGDVWQYEWDTQNRLVRVKKSNAGTGNLQTITEYTYDHRGYRVKKVVYGDTGTETTYYTFGVGGEVLYKENTATLKYEEFVYVGGYYFAEITGTTDTAETVKYFYITDTLGSVTAMTDDDGRVVWTNEYLAFGNETGNTGFIDAPNIYTGHEFDEDVQLYYARARWYDSEMGRFISIDPARDGVNWFAYAANNPLRFVDPSGLDVQNAPDVNNEEYQKYQKRMYLAHIQPDSAKVYDKFVSIMERKDQNNKKLSTYYENIFLYTLILEGKIKASDSLFNACDREAIGEIIWQVESSLRKLRMSRDTGKFSYLTANKERNGKNPQIADLDETELILLADTMRKEVETMKATYAIVSIAAHWALRTSILNYNIKTFSQTSTINVGKGMTRVGRWMSIKEYQLLKKSGFVQEGRGGVTYASTTGPESFFKQAANGSVYVEYDVPTNSLLPGGQEGWVKTIGPNAAKSQQYMLQKQGGGLLPEAINISDILIVKKE